MDLSEMVAKWEAGNQWDYEIRNLVHAYRDGVLDEEGLETLREELERNG